MYALDPNQRQLGAIQKVGTLQGGGMGPPKAFESELGGGVLMPKRTYALQKIPTSTCCFPS